MMCVLLVLKDLMSMHTIHLSGSIRKLCAIYCPKAGKFILHFLAENSSPRKFLENDESDFKLSGKSVEMIWTKLTDDLCFFVIECGLVMHPSLAQALPGYPVWVLATQSYLLSDQGTSTDCLVEGNINGCSTNCIRFVPPFDFTTFTTPPGGYLMVC